MSSSSGDVQLLRADPSLGRDLPEAQWEAARNAAVAASLDLPAGAFTLDAERATGQGHFGFLVLAGLAVRELAMGEIVASELLLPGDVIQPTRRFGRRESHGSVELQWRSVMPTRVAVLDHEFATRIAPWPQLTAALLSRALERADSQVFLSAVRTARRVEDRVWLALWHLATPRGGPDADAPTRQIKISGQALANVIGARRQSVSTALGRLADRGVVRRTGDGTLAVLIAPPASS